MIIIITVTSKRLNGGGARRRVILREAELTRLVRARKIFYLNTKNIWTDKNILSGEPSHSQRGDVHHGVRTDPAGGPGGGGG